MNIRGQSFVMHDYDSFFLQMAEGPYDVIVHYSVWAVAF